MPTWEHGGRISAFGFDGGGPVGTALVAAARLGANVGYVGTAGSDEAAEIKVRALVRDGVDVSRMIVRSGPENQVILVCVDKDTGERVFAGLHSRREEPLMPNELDRDYIISAPILHLDGYHPDAALQAARWMREAGGRVVLDAAKTSGPIDPSLRALLEHVDVLVCGSGFAPALTGRTDLWEAGCAALEYGPQIVVQTEGERGSYTVSTEEAFHMPAFAVDVVDTTGAGDVFHGAYIVGLLKGWPLRAIAQFASAVAAYKCTTLGGRVGIPRYDQVVAFLASRGIAIEEGVA